MLHGLWTATRTPSVTVAANWISSTTRTPWEIDIAGNPLMQNMMEVIYEFVLTQMVRTTPSQRENALGRKLHKAILQAVREHDPDSAADAMQQHMQAVLDRLAKESS